MSSSQDDTNIFDRLREHRVIFVRDSLDAAEANRIIAELLHLEARDATAEITLRINCAHADVQAALAVYDTMQAIRPPVGTLCGGTAAGGAAQVLLEQPRGRLDGRSREIDLEARRLLRLGAQMNELLAKHTGQPLERIERDTDRGLSLNAAEARAYGLTDHIAGGA